MKEINRLKEVLVEQKKRGQWFAKNLGKETETVFCRCNNQAQPSIETFSHIAKLQDIV